MVIRLEPIQGEAHIGRVSREGGEMPPIEAVFVLERDKDDPTAVWVKAMKGSLTRSDMRDLLWELAKLGAETVLARRRDGHTLPFGETDAEGITRIEMDKLVKRFA